MKKILLTLSLFCTMTLIQAQNGLENIIVEVYYLSDANDSLATDAISLSPGALPVGSITYRIYADLMQGYKFQAGYGVSTHELRFETSTAFFNNEDRGAAQPNYSKNLARNNTVMLDSWLSAGAGCLNNFGIQKTEDDGVATVVNNNVPPVLQNNHPSAGIPLTTQDGLLSGAPLAVTFVPTPPPVFDNTQFGNVFSERNFSWAALGGSVGPDTTNKVLIAQMTTNGVFSFKLNIQIGGPGGSVENYVADSAAGSEIQLSSLMQTFNPSVITGLQSLSQPASVTFSVYPNPSHESLAVEIRSARNSPTNTLVVYDVVGKEILQKHLGVITGTHQEKLDVSSLANGIYILKLISDGSVSSSPFIKN